jgi:hypothetical protein
MKLLEPNEHTLVGRWVDDGNTIVPDEVCKRIDSLVHDYLVKIGSDTSGWSVLFRDPRDNRLWELTYPSSDSHGGGPPLLRSVDSDTAKQRYKFS